MTSRTTTIIIIVVAVAVILALVAWTRTHRNAPEGEKEIPLDLTTLDTVGGITFGHPKSWQTGEAGSSTLQFALAGRTATLSVESGLEAGTLKDLQADLDDTPWREVTVTSQPGIEIGRGGSEEGALDAQFEYYNEALMARGERIVVVVTLSDEDRARFEKSAFDPHALLTQQDLDELRAVVANAKLSS